MSVAQLFVVSSRDIPDLTTPIFFTLQGLDVSAIKLKNVLEPSLLDLRPFSHFILFFKHCVHQKKNILADPGGNQLTTTVDLAVSFFRKKHPREAESFHF